MEQRLKIKWEQSAEELHLSYRKERNSHRKIRLQALWQLRCGKRIQEVSDNLGVCYRTLQYWVAWYRSGGLAEVLRRIPGHGHPLSTKLKRIQQQALAAKVALGTFRTVWEVIQWVKDRWGILYSYSGLHACLQRLACAPKVPRPQSVKAEAKVQNEWKANGLRDALQEAGIQHDKQVWFCDEMRFGLWGQVRKRWGRRGVKLIQKVQIEFTWEYLVLAVDIMRCELRWAWASRMNQASLIPIFKEWLPEVVVWDGASVHRGKAIGEVGFKRISLPPYSPELNPSERVFEWLRSRIEGEVYTSLSHKRYTIERYLRQLNAAKAHLRRLIRWQWIQDAFVQASLA